MKIKAVSFFLALILITVAVPFSVTVSGGELSGDVNFDGKINSIDYLIVKRMVLGTFEGNLSQIAAADVNSDRKATSADYLLLKRHVLGTYNIPQSTRNIDVAIGKLYTVSAEPGANYPDSYSCELTDGVYVTAEEADFYDSRFSGYQEKYLEVVIDLKDSGKYLNAFELHYLSVDTAGIYIPYSISVDASSDNTEWQHLGNMNIPEFVSGTTASATLSLEEEVEYRYIKFSVSGTHSWLFFDEIMVYANVLNLSAYSSYLIEKAYKSESTLDSEKITAISSVSDGVPYDKNKGMSVISVGSNVYASENSFDNRISNDISRYTDGAETGANFALDRFAGLDITEGNSITVDLGSVQNDICGFAVYCMQRTAISAILPLYTDISVSTDGINFVTIGRVYGTISNVENFRYYLTTSVLINSRYVRFTMPPQDGFVWIEEIEVLANRGYERDAFVYGELDMDFTGSSDFWNSSESNYNSEINLISGKTQQIVSETFLDIKNYGDPENIQMYNDPETCTLLTDGSTTNNKYCYSGGWMHFYLGGGRTVFYDLTKVSRIDSFSVRILEYPSMGIYAPSIIRLLLSENGTDWYLSGQINTSASDSSNILLAEYSLDLPVRARYAAIYFDVKMHVFIDEITINGRKSINGASQLYESGYNKYGAIFNSDSSEGYATPSPDILGGAKDITLVYHNMINDNENYYKPYVAYLDTNGNIIDTLFDGYLYLPSTASLPSGGKPYGTNIYSDWDYLFSDIFAYDQGLYALDRTATLVKNTLGLTDYKLKVFIAIPHLDTTLTDFGDVDGDGISEDLTEMPNRIKVARVYSERVINAFNNASFENLELCGFYWFHEAISGDDIDTAKNVTASLKEIDMPLFWIPYYNAAGYSRWDEFGFEVGCLQPNYAFSESVTKERLYYAAMYAKRYGMCIEIETSEAALSNEVFYRKYIDYLSCGVKYGYIDAIHMYYQSGSVFYNECYSSNPKVRLLYDYTYQFIKGTLNIYPNAPDDYSVIAAYNSSYSGILHAANGGSALYRLETSPQHGTVTVNENGEFVYYPNKGFRGTDEFKYSVSSYYEWSEPTTVTVRVY